MKIFVTNEDAFVMSESTAKEMSSPFVEKIRVRINTHDILLNLYGNGDEKYKTFPNVGEMVRDDGILIGHRRISYNEIINKFQDSQLQKVMDGDAVKYVNNNSRVVDIDIWNNNDIDKLKEEVYNSQVLQNYASIMNYYDGFVKFLEPIINDNSKDVSRNLRNYYNEIASFRDPISEFEEDGRRFDNLVMEFTISFLEPINLGSKMTSR